MISFYFLQRARVLKQPAGMHIHEGKGVVYWMFRDMRVYDNWALQLAQSLAIEDGLPLYVVYCLAPDLPHPTRRRVDFLFGGLKEVERDLEAQNIGFRLLCGEPKIEIPAFLEAIQANLLVTDHCPLRFFKVWYYMLCLFWAF